MEPILLITNVADRHASEMGQQLVRHRLGSSSLAGEYHAVCRDQSLARHTGVRIGGEERVQYRIAQAIGDLVGMTLGDRLGGEQILACIAHGALSVTALAWFGTGGV
jgi:hypothetical protein